MQHSAYPGLKVVAKNIADKKVSKKKGIGLFRSSGTKK